MDYSEPPEIPIERFEIYANGLDHPECLAFDRDGMLWAGGEAGQVYRIAPGGVVEMVAGMGGFCAGVAWLPDDGSRKLASLIPDARLAILDGNSLLPALSDWDLLAETIDDFLTSVFLCMRHQIPLMLASGGGVIVNNSSVDGLRGYPFAGGASYSAAKHGVLGLTKSAALEHAATGPRITAICPGWVETPPVVNYMRRDASKASEIIRQTPRGRIASPEEIANGVLWLCSDAASFMTGSPLVIDGGYMA